MTFILAPWSLGRWGSLVNAIAILWCVLIAIVFVLPPNELVFWTMLAFALALAVYWQVWKRRGH
jgi:hypothetical protein